MNQTLKKDFGEAVSGDPGTIDWHAPIALPRAKAAAKRGLKLNTCGRLFLPTNFIFEEVNEEKGE